MKPNTSLVLLFVGLSLIAPNADCQHRLYAIYTYEGVCIYESGRRCKQADSVWHDEQHRISKLVRTQLFREDTAPVVILSTVCFYSDTSANFAYKSITETRGRPLDSTLTQQAGRQIISKAYNPAYSTTTFYYLLNETSYATTSFQAERNSRDGVAETRHDAEKIIYSDSTVEVLLPRLTTDTLETQIYERDGGGYTLIGLGQTPFDASEHSLQCDVYNGLPQNMVKKHLYQNWVKRHGNQHPVALRTGNWNIAYTFDSQSRVLTRKETNAIAPNANAGATISVRYFY